MTTPVERLMEMRDEAARILAESSSLDLTNAFAITKAIAEDRIEHMRGTIDALDAAIRVLSGETTIDFAKLRTRVDEARAELRRGTMHGSTGRFAVRKLSMSGYLEAFDAMLVHVDTLRAERDTLAKHIRTSVVRFEILLGRAEACDVDSNRKTHELTRFEVPGWIEELNSILAKS